MTAEENDEITALCNRVIEEKDPAKFRELVVQTQQSAGTEKAWLEKPQPKANLRRGTLGFFSFFQRGRKVQQVVGGDVVKVIHECSKNGLQLR